MTNNPDDGLRAALPAPLDERQAAALAEASAWVGDDVVAVGLGETAEGTPCVIVHTGRPDVDLPAEVAGLPVRVQVSGPIHAYDPTRIDPTGEPSVKSDSENP